ncbi:MAG: hypothetical protein J5916_05255 [Oscillospiraceae bacterium]|nr:hypothetical protein [Oscillospiraceae bacterium]
MSAGQREKSFVWTKDTNPTGIAAHVYVHDIMLHAICKVAFTDKNGKKDHKSKMKRRKIIKSLDSH